MAIIHSDYLQCKCGNDTFTEETHIQFHKNVRDREFAKSFSIPPANKEFLYRCTSCKEILDK